MTKEQRKFMDIWGKVRARYDEWLDWGCNIGESAQKATNYYFELYLGADWLKKTDEENYARIFDFIFADIQNTALDWGMYFESEPVDSPWTDKSRMTV